MQKATTPGRGAAPFLRRKMDLPNMLNGEILIFFEVFGEENEIGFQSLPLLLVVAFMEIDAINILKRGVMKRECVLRVMRALLNRLSQDWGIE